mmetsp:Transcript_12309/g.37042  ORF Transcript_12309/g.37042 Transcript_12309/m.37042 type:complete len:230 (-) Transcript_12309:4417-5106(-)
MDWNTSSCWRACITAHWPGCITTQLKAAAGSCQPCGGWRNGLGGVGSPCCLLDWALGDSQKGLGACLGLEAALCCAGGWKNGLGASPPGRTHPGGSCLWNSELRPLGASMNGLGGGLWSPVGGGRLMRRMGDEFRLRRRGWSYPCGVADMDDVRLDRQWSSPPRAENLLGECSSREARLRVRRKDSRKGFLRELSKPCALAVNQSQEGRGASFLSSIAANGELMRVVPP